MLLPDSVQPKNSIYYNGAIVLEILLQVRSINFLELFGEVRKVRDMSLKVFVLCLDWLYLIDAAVLNEKGNVELCS
jgi:hypothetical protein